MSNWKQFCIIIFVICFFLAAPSYAAVVNAPIIGDDTITQDTEVVLNGFFPESKPNYHLGADTQSGIIADAGKSIIGDSGVVVSVDMDQYAYIGPVYGIVAWGRTITSESALVSLDEVHVSIARKAAGTSSSMGVFAQYGSEVRIGDNSEVYAYYRGIALSSAEGSTLTIGDNAALYGTMYYYGAVNIGGSLESGMTTMNIGNNAVISNDGYYAENVYGRENSHHYAVKSYASRTAADDAVMSLLTIGDSADIYAMGSGNWNVGLLAGELDIDWWAGEIVTGSNTTVNTYGANNNMGLTAYWTGSVITIGADSDVTTRGNTSYGAYARYGGQINIGAGGSIVTNGDSSSGLVASGSAVSGYTSVANSVIRTSDDVTVETTGKGAHGALASSASSDFGAQVLLDEGNKIITRSDDSYGIAASGGGAVVSAGAGLEIDTYGNSAHGAVARNGGYVSMDGASISVSENSSAAITASSSTGKSSIVSGSGVFDITGNMSAGAYGSIDMTLENGSLFTGATGYISGDTTSELTMTLNGVNSEWDVTSNSELTNLYMNGSAVDMTYAALGAEIFVISLGQSASDNGVFRMNADIADEFADHIYVGGVAQGTYRIDVVNDGGQVTTGDELTDLVYVNQGQSAVFTLDHIVELGGFQYELAQPDQDTGTTFLTPRADHFENAWYLRGNGRASVPGSGAINSFAGSYLMAYADTQTLIQRMGDLRSSPYGQGLWFRVHGGKFESNSKTYVRGFDMDYGGVQIGYDRKLENKWDGTIYTGIMFGYSKGDLDYGHEGSGEVDSKTLGIYGTYIGRSGFYVDAIIKYQWMTNDFDVIDTAGTLVRGQDTDTGGIGASVEFGQRLHVGKGKESNTGWYVEPQVQLSYQRQDGGYFNATNGLRIGVEPFTSILGRVGMLVGYETEKNNLYAKVSKVKEFDGDLTINANGVYIPESFASSWWVYGIGYTSRINDRNSLYLDIERTSGGSFRQPWRVFAGWRIEF